MSQPPSAPVKVAISGCGAAFEHLHCAPLRHAASKGWITVEAAADPGEKRRAVAQKLFPGLRTYASTAEMFSREQGLQLAVIASPPAFHFADTLAALQAGAHVLCEKPLAASVADGDAMCQAAEKAGRVLATGMTRRFYPAVAALRARVAALPADTPVRFLFRQGGVFGWPVASDAPFRRETAGGGVLLDMGVHLTDIVGSLFGWGEAVSCQDDAEADGVEANAVVEVRLARASGRLHLSWDTNMDSALQIKAGADEWWMPSGSIDVLWHRRSSGAWTREPTHAGFPADPGPDPAMKNPRSHEECMLYQLVAMLRSIHWGEAPAATGQEGLAALKILHGAYAVATPLDKAWLPPAERAARLARHWRA